MISILHVGIGSYMARYIVIVRNSEKACHWQDRHEVYTIGMKFTFDIFACHSHTHKQQPAPNSAHTFNIISTPIEHYIHPQYNFSFIQQQLAKMVSQTKSSINIALCIGAMLVAASTTQAQLANVPKRYRSKNSVLVDQEFGRHSRQQKNQQASSAARRNLRHLEGSMSMVSNDGLDFTGLTRMKGFDLDGSMSMSMPQNIVVPDGDSEPSESTQELESNNGSDTVVMASFLAGISALVVGAMALFVKMRQRHSRQLAENDETSNDNQRVWMASMDEFNDFDDTENPSGQDIVIS